MDSIRKELLFNYISLSVISFWFFNNAYIPDISFIVSMISCVVIIYYINTLENTSSDNLNNELLFKLNFLLHEEGKPAPEYFHLEPDMINFFYKIRDFRIYNRDAYYKAIKHTNLLLKIVSELENDYFYIQQFGYESWQMFGPVSRPAIQTNIKNHKEIFQKAKHHAQLVINHLHSFAVTIPGGIFRKKFNYTFKECHILIKRILDLILLHCKKYSKDLLIGEHYGLPKPMAFKNRAHSNFDFVLI